MGIKDMGSEYGVDVHSFNIDFKSHVVDTQSKFNHNHNWMITDDGKSSHFLHGMDCVLCGVRLEILNFNPDDPDNTPYVESECTTPPDVVTEVVIPVPSGKLVVTDNLIREYKLPEGFEHKLLNSLQFKQGRVNHTLEYAKQNVLYVQTIGFASLYLSPKGEMVFASLSEDDEEKGDWKELAYNTRDLWAYMAVDYQKLIDDGFEETLQEPYRTITVVDVEPGTYKFANLVEKEGFDPYSYETTIFGTVERISD